MRKVKAYRGKHRVRCKKCQHRRTFNQHPDAYTKRHRWLVKCVCGFTGKQPGDLPWRIDHYRTSGREHRRVLCKCDNYPFPHRRGSRWCRVNEDRWTDADRQEYEERMISMMRK